MKGGVLFPKRDLRKTSEWSGVWCIPMRRGWMSTASFISWPCLRDELPSRCDGSGPSPKTSNGWPTGCRRVADLRRAVGGDGIDRRLLRNIQVLTANISPKPLMFLPDECSRRARDNYVQKGDGPAKCCR